MQDVYVIDFFKYQRLRSVILVNFENIFIAIFCQKVYNFQTSATFFIYQVDTADGQVGVL